MSSEPPYNPNAIWTSKEKKYSYTPKPRMTASGGRFDVKKGDDDHGKGDAHHDGGGGGGGGKKNTIIIVLVICGLALLGIGAYLLLKPAPPVLAQITFTEPNQAAVGDPFPFTISYANNSGATFKGATLTLTLPAGLSFAGESPDQQVMQWSVGDLLPGASGSESSTLIATENPASVANATVALTYNPDASGRAQSQTDATANIVIGPPAVGLTITAPGMVASGQNFTMRVAYVNSTADVLGDVKVALQYPSVFNFMKSSVAPDSAQDDEWDVGSLAAGASGNFTVTGTMAGESSATYAVVGTADADFSGENYEITSQAANLAIATSPLTLTVALDDSQDHVAGLADPLDYTFTYGNTSNVTLQDAVITAKFVGAMFDFSALQSGGSFSSITNTVTWSGANTPALLNIAPGQTGTVDVTVRTLNSFPIRLLSDKNYLLKVNGQIMSPTVPPGTAGSSTVSVTGITNKVGGAIAFAATGYFHDANSTIVNSGPYPPKVNQATQYTIHWDATDYSTDIANVTVSAYLQSGTTCTGQMQSNVASSTPTCDAANGLVSWTIPSVPATTGVISPPAEAIFQVVNTPAVNQVGQNVTLLGQSTVTASDTFTGLTLTATAPPVDTSIPEDTSVGGQSRQVGE